MIEDVVVDIGTQLKAQREKLGCSLQEAAEHTRIRKTYLESIENNNFADLPGHAYVTGFIKSYALFLGVDKNHLLARLEELRLSDGPPPLKPISIVKHQSKRFRKSSSGSGWSSFALGFLGVIVLGCMAYFVTTMFQDKVPAEVTSERVVLEKEPLQEPVQNQNEASLEPDVASGAAEQEVVTPLKEELSSVSEELEPPELKSLPFVPAGGSSFRVLALSEGALIIDADDRKSHQYNLHEGLDLTWDIKNRVKVELTGAGIARFWLGAQELEVGEMEFFQLQTESGD